MNIYGKCCLLLLGENIGIHKILKIRNCAPPQLSSIILCVKMLNMLVAWSEHDWQKLARKTCRHKPPVGLWCFPHHLNLHTRGPSGIHWSSLKRGKVFGWSPKNMPNIYADQTTQSPRGMGMRYSPGCLGLRTNHPSKIPREFFSRLQKATFLRETPMDFNHNLCWQCADHTFFVPPTKT